MVKLQNPIVNIGYMPLKRHIALPDVSYNYTFTILTERSLHL